MKKTTSILSMLICSSLALSGAGCKPGVPSGEQPKTVEEGMAQLRAALVNAGPEVQSNFYSGVSYGIRYDNYPDALLALSRITSDPGLNGRQKQLANNLGELLKQAMQNDQNAPKPAP